MSSAPLVLAAGQVSSVDSLSPAPTSVINWQVDAADINRPRPALVTYTTTGLGTSPLIGLYVWRTWVIGVTADRKLWALPEVNPTVWTALSDATAATQLDGGERPVFAEDGSRVVVAGGGLIQKWEGVGLSARLGGGPTATHVVLLGGRLVANNTAAPSEYDWSNQGDGVHGTWDPLAFDDNRRDPIVAIGENLNELYNFGTTTTQVNSVSGDPFFPYDPTVTSAIGVIAPYSIVKMDQQFAVLDNRRRFVTTDGRTETVISDAISKDLRNFTTVDDCWGYREDFDAFTNIVWMFPTEGRCFVYNTARQSWTERQKYTAPFQGPMPQNCYVYWPALNIHLVGSSATGALYRLDANTRQDLGGALVCERYTGWNDFGTKDNKRDEVLIITMRRGTVTLGAVESALEVRCRDDGGAWSDWDYLLLGQPSDAEQTLKVRLGGVFKRRMYHFRYSGSDDVSLVSAEQYFEALTEEEEAA